MALEHDETSQEQESTGSVDGSGIGGDAGGDGGDGSDLSGVLGGGEGGGFVSEEKKPLNTGTLVMAGFLLACGAGTYFMYNRSAKAGTQANAETSAAQQTITQFLSDDKENVNKMKELLDNTGNAVEQFKASPGKKQVPLDDLRTNPFRVAEDGGPAQPDEDVDALTAKKRADAARAAALKAAQQLKLTFVMSGGKQKSCMINNVVYREGETIGEFTVEQINTDSVVVRAADQKFKIPIRN